MGRIHGENKYLTDGTQLSMSGARQKCHCMRYEKILHGYDDFRTYVVIRSLRDTNICM